MKSNSPGRTEAVHKANRSQSRKMVPPRAGYRRVVVKAGTSVLTSGPKTLNVDAVSGLVAQIATLHASGAEVILVTSGAVAAGRQNLGISHERRDIPFRQVLAAVGQSHLMHIYQQAFEGHGIRTAQALLTWKDLADRQSYLNVRNTLLALLELRVVPVLNENDVVAVDEIGEVFGDNDRLSALVANLVDADLLAILTDTDGLYTADPRVDPDARLIRCVEKVDADIEALAGEHRDATARGGMPTKLEAARLATSAGVAAVICNGSEGDVLVRLHRGEEVGTLFLPAAGKMEARKRWMLSGLSTRGQIVVDDGAAVALREQNRSLLPPGVSSVGGEFQRGDIVYVLGLGGDKVACGMANYSSADLSRIQGVHSDRIQGILGYHYGQEVVHRNNMVLL